MPGLYYDEFTVGQVFRHALRRTVTEADNTFFSALTMNPAALHLDEQYCQEHSEFGTRIVNSAFTLGLVVGISVGDTTLGTTVGNLGWDEVRFPKPVFHGDTIRVESEVVELRDEQVAAGQRHRRVRAPRLQPAERNRHELQAQRIDAQARRRYTTRGLSRRHATSGGTCCAPVSWTSHRQH